MEFFKFFKNLISKREQFGIAIDEISDLPAAFVRMHDVVAMLATIAMEMDRALKDGKLTKKELANVTSRQRDLITSLNSVMAEVDEAWEALKPFIGSKA